MTSQSRSSEPQGKPSSSANADRPQAPQGSIDLNDEQNVTAWCEHFGVTRTQLIEAVRAAGVDGDAVREHLLNQGASAGAS